MKNFTIYDRQTNEHFGDFDWTDDENFTIYTKNGEYKYFGTKNDDTIYIYQKDKINQGPIYFGTINTDTIWLYDYNRNAIFYCV